LTPTGVRMPVASVDGAPDPHGWFRALLTPGELQRIVELGNQLVGA